MNERILEKSVGKVDLDEMRILSLSGAGDVEPQATPTITTSSIPCISATVASVTAVTDFATNFFSCGKFCK